jgi:hypothetical protein
MMYVKAICVLLISTCLFSCKNKHDTVKLGFEKDLLPEGIAIDAPSKTVFLNSLTSNKIVRCNLDGSEPRDFIKNNEFGYLSGFGMTIKGDTLYALSNSLPKKDNQSVLILLNSKTGQLFDSYSLETDSFTFLNDLAVSENHTIYATDSESNKIYTINRTTKRFEIYLDIALLAHSNGIAISEDNQQLYIASSNGIVVVDIETKEILNVPNKDFSGIDGLKFYKNTLIGIVNQHDDMDKNGVFRYYFDDKRTTIIRKEKIVSFDSTFNIPTTFDIFDAHLYFIINTQIDNINEETNQIIDTKKLESYILMKKKIK